MRPLVPLERCETSSLFYKFLVDQLTKSLKAVGTFYSEGACFKRMGHYPINILGKVKGHLKIPLSLRTASDAGGTSLRFEIDLMYGLVVYQT